jgi:SAM-dependent methyltransferase
MRKDYLPASAEDAAADDVAFVERYWTAQWKDHASQPDLSALSRREEFRVMQPFLAGLPQGSRILDGGCGLGEWTIFLAQQGFDTTGVDISETIVDRLQRWCPGRAFVRADLRRTDFETGAFDAYFSWGAFEHFENGLGECLAEAHRLVRPGGWLFVSVPFDNWRLILRDARALERWDENFDPKLGYRQPQRFYQWRLTRPELQRELELHGFNVHTIRPIGKLAGAGRMLQWDLRLFPKGSRAYYVARRALAAALPASFISHMILAAAERR